MDELVKEFIDETIESLSEMDVDLVTLEQDPSNEELLGKIFRLMHTIKGTCGFIGLGRLEKTAHSAENLLDDFRNGKMEVTQEAMTVIFQAIDRIRFLVDEVSANGVEPEGEDSDVINLIENFINGVSGESADTSDTQADAADAEADVAAAFDAAPVDVAPAEVDVVVPVKKEAAVPAPKGATPAKPTASASKEPEYLRVQMTVLEDLINMVSELVLTRNQMSQLIRSDVESELQTPFQRLNRIVSDLQDTVMQTRMQPIQNAWTKLPRIVRDLSTEAKKKINLDMIGGDTELDRQVLEMIKDPLTHMIRNSCDHGIETPAERKAAGKTETGIIKLSSYHEGGFVVIRISDDGKGLDPQKILSKIIEKDMVTAEKAAEMSEKEILSYIMRPGFSTAEKVTNVSGRGVGMDVVRSNIEQIGGFIDMDSTLGKGTVFTIQIPLTLAIISALIFEIDDHRYAIPQMNIQELVTLKSAERDKVEQINNQPVLRLRDRIIPLLDSSKMFDKEKEDGCVSQYKDKLIVIISVGTNCFGIIADKVYDTEEVVIKSISSVMKSTEIYAGNSILGDGKVIMILDPAAISRKFNVEKVVSKLSAEVESKDAGNLEETASMLMFRAGNGAPKAVPLAMVSRLHVFEQKDVTLSADKIVVKYNDDLMQVMLVEPEDQELSDKNITTLIIADDRSESSMGLVIDEVIDIVEGTLNLTTTTGRDGISGSMILGDVTVDVLDLNHFLTANASNWFSSQSHAAIPYVVGMQRVNGGVAAVANGNGAAVATVTGNGSAGEAVSNGNGAGPNLVSSMSRSQRVLVVDDSNFFRNMLYPILSSAGYEVTLAEDAIVACKMHDEGVMFDIIVSDIEMPHMDGYEFVEKMRNESSWKDLPFVAITSHNTPEDAEYGYKKGFDQYIGKLDRKELLETLSTVRH